MPFILPSVWVVVSVLAVLWSGLPMSAPRELFHLDHCSVSAVPGAADSLRPHCRSRLLLSLGSPPWDHSWEVCLVFSNLLIAGTSWVLSSPHAGSEEPLSVSALCTAISVPLQPALFRTTLRGPPSRPSHGRSKLFVVSSFSAFSEDFIFLNQFSQS